MKSREKELIAVFQVDDFIIEESISEGKAPFYDQELLTNFSKNKYQALFDLGFVQINPNMSSSLTFLYHLAHRFISELSKNSDIEITRRAEPVKNACAIELLREIPFAIGIENVGFSWIGVIWDKLSQVFQEEIDSWKGTVAEYLHSKNSEINVVGRVFFHLVENRDEEFPFAFLATYSTGNREKVNHLPLKNALLEYKKEQNKLLALLSTVSRTCDQSDFISELVESGELFSPLKFTSQEAYIFLCEVELYEQCGVVCRIPDWWKKKGSARVSVTVGDKAPSAVGLEALISFNPSIYLGDLELTREEIETLLRQTNGLSYLKGKWVEVNHDKLKAALKAFDRIKDLEDMTFAEAMRMQLDINSSLEVDKQIELEISNGEWLKNLNNRLLDPNQMESLFAGEEFLAELRHYQQTGLNWLGLMKQLGFGALLADDMGLGKTIQILALLEYLRQNGGAKVLLIIPASLLFNWQKEADKFAPKLRYTVIHAQNKTFDIESYDLFITTYGMATKVEELSLTRWDLIILDEAQAIKNPGTKQTKAVKSLKATSKIAMTGTPIENRLTDLWSIFDFLNQGLLGTAKEFTNFTKSLKEDGTGYSRLRNIVNPFILRRLKTDKTVISDLPDKIEMKSFASLTKKQIVLYNGLVKDLEKALENSEGIERKGLVLASIMKFKQICNHPDQYLGQKSYDSAHSGKFEKLGEICETIAEKHERVLVFTQFQEMTEPLCDFMETIFNKRGLVLHGGTPVKKRGELVELFNGEQYMPYMVLSLKAGGVGLNLTSANHVIHFDRWWNPAIENQATDRAFRIGQEKNVMVHKFITTGTIEEKIDEMLEEKISMAEDIIAQSGESWIMEMDHKDLMNLFRLEV